MSKFEGIGNGRNGKSREQDDDGDGDCRLPTRVSCGFRISDFGFGDVMMEDLSMHVLDIAMNSLTAGARHVQVALFESVKRDWLVLRVQDDGHGMDEKTLNMVLNRPSTTKKSRKKNIGLGLALLRQASEMSEGHFHVRSAPGKGTRITASMRYSHVDRPPLGDLNATILALSTANPETEVQLYYHSDEGKFQFSSKELNAEGNSKHEPRRTQKA